MNKTSVSVQADRFSLGAVLRGTAGPIWDLLALKLPRLRQTQVMLARSVRLSGVWESEFRGAPLPLKRRRQFVRIDALDDRQKYGFHPEGDDLRQIRVEGVIANSEVLRLQWNGGTNTWCDFVLPAGSCTVNLSAIRITSDLGVPVKVRWMCDEGLAK